MNKQLSKLDYGKLPPHDIDIEEAILGSVLSERKPLFLASKSIIPEHFYKYEHRMIYQSVLNVLNGSGNVDIITVCADLRDKKLLESVGGTYYISRLINQVASSANFEAHCRILAQKYIGREIINISTKTAAEAYNQSGDVFDLLSQTVAQLHNVSKNVNSKNDKTIEQYLAELTDRVDKNLAGIVPGVPTGVKKYDAATGGQGKGNMIIYAARPGMGKTARMCNEAYYQISNNIAVCIHSLEMTGMELLARIIGLHLSIPPSDIMRKKINKTKFLEGLEWVKTKPLRIFESNNLKSIILETHLYKSSLPKGMDFIGYIDYLQLIKAGKQNTIDNVSEASREIKQLAKETESPMIALAQLSRAVETRGGDKRPQLSDLRESGQIEQDADVVEFLYRPEYYGIMQDEDGESTAGVTYYLNAKNRSGEPGITTKMFWNGPLNKLSETQEYIPLPTIESKMPIGVGFDDDNPF